MLKRKVAMAEALYRKYRPQVFEDVVGQEPIERTLKNAIGQDKVSHAYLFTGPRGTGKTTTARLLAKALLCKEGPTPEPDGTCEDCSLIAEGTHPDVYELDAASRTGVENVREEIISRVSFAPTRGRFKVYIIDEVHMLSTAAFNALLKTLEEPPSHVVFILCTTDPQKVPETIHSRCQRFDFRRIEPEAMVSRLGAICIAENVEFEGEALDLIAHRAEGGLRNALTSLEQIIAFEDGKVTLAGAERLLGSIDSNDMAEIIAYVGQRDIANCFRWTAEYVETGADLAQFVRDMAEHVRNLYVMALVGEDVDLEVTETSRLELAGELKWFGVDRLSRLLGVLGDLSAELKTSSNQRLAFEIALTRMVRPDSDLTLESLAERVEALESGYSAVAHVFPGQPGGAGQVGNRGFFNPGIDGDTAFADDATTMPPVSATSASGMSAETVESPSGQPRNSRHPVADAARSGSEVPRKRAQESTQAAPSGNMPEASVEAPADGGKLAALANPAALQRIWQASLSTLKKQKQSFGVLFMGTKARFDSERGLVRVVFPAESSFVFNAAQKPDVQEALAAVLEKTAGEAVPFVFEQVGKEPSKPVGAGRAAGASAAAGAPAAAGNAGSEAADRSAAAPVASSTSRNVQPQLQSQGELEQKAAERQRDGSVPGSQSAQGAAEPSYDEVPYEEMPYEPVPYEELDGYASDGRAMEASSANAHVEGGKDASSSPGQMPDAVTSPSPAQSSLRPDGSTAEDPSDVQALLQEGFGGGVVFTEVDD